MVCQETEEIPKQVSLGRLWAIRTQSHDLGSHYFELEVPDSFGPVSHLNAFEGDLELERVEEGAGIVQHYHIAHVYFGHTLSERRKTISSMTCE
jgi:hypothetical protein